MRIELQKNVFTLAISATISTGQKRYEKTWQTHFRMLYCSRYNIILISLLLTV